MSELRFQRHGYATDEKGERLWQLVQGRTPIISFDQAWWQELHNLLHAQPWIEDPGERDKQPGDAEAAMLAPSGSHAKRMADAALKSAELSVLSPDSEQSRDRAEAAERLANAAKALGEASMGGALCVMR